MAYSEREKLTTLSELFERKEDKLYKKYSNINIDKDLDRIVKDIVYKKMSKFLGIGYYKSHYTKSCTLSEYVKNALKFIGDGDFEMGKRLFYQRIQTIRNHIISRNQQYTNEMIDNAIMKNIFFITFIGFAFEEILSEVLKSEDFTIVESEQLDNEYNIDLLATKNGISVGIQCKSISYLHMNRSIKEKHLQKQIKAIQNAECHTTIYIYHNEDLNVVDSNNNVMSIEELIQYIMKNISKFKS